MIDLIQENMDTSIAIFTLIVSVLVIFLGLGDDKKDKQEQLKFILVSYAIIILIILYTSKLPKFTIGILLLFFVIGGLSYSINDQFDLEKELNIPQLLLYSSFSWFFITSNYFFIFSIILIHLLIYILNISYSLSLVIICFSLIAQYLSIVKDYFGINSYKETLSKLKNINLGVKNNKHAEDIFEEDFLNDKLELVAFVLYVEDRFLFDRKQCHISFTNILNSKRDPVIFKDKINYEQRTKFEKYKRGYSTIEQQLIRQYSISDQAYRYKYRRKIFFDWLYTPLFSKAICLRKSRVYGKKKNIAKKELIWNLKLIFLYNYFVNVLKNPKDTGELITNMSQQSRVEENVYRKMFEIFNDSSKKEEMTKKIQENLQKEYNFY
ncbi:hypothetical protein [Vagococcus fluvialis]|uniref:hypothetical protein n=1 Tax=Vagococcus fluvialis TaxID=2738 RepID=UPI003D0B73E3